MESKPTGAPEPFLRSNKDEICCTTPSFIANLFRNDDMPSATSTEPSEGKSGDPENDRGCPLVPPSADELEAIENQDNKGGKNDSTEPHNELVNGLMQAESPPRERRSLQPPSLAELELIRGEDKKASDSLASKVPEKGLYMRELKQFLLPQTLVALELDKKEDNYWQVWSEPFKTLLATIANRDSNYFPLYFLRKIFNPLRKCGNCGQYNTSLLAPGNNPLELFIVDRGIVGRIKVHCTSCGETEPLVSCEDREEIPTDSRMRITLEKTEGDFVKKITHQEVLHDLMELLHIAAIEHSIENKKRHLELAEFLLKNARRVCEQWCRIDYRDLRIKKFIRFREEVLLLTHNPSYKPTFTREYMEMYEMMANSFRQNRDHIHTILQAIKDSLIDSPSKSQCMFWIAIALLHAENYYKFKEKYDPRSCMRIDEGEYWALHDRYIGLDAPVGVKKIPVIFVLFELPRFYHYIEFLERNCGRRTKIFLTKEERFELSRAENEAIKRGHTRPKKSGVIISPEKHLDFLQRQEDLVRMTRNKEFVESFKKNQIAETKKKKKGKKKASSSSNKTNELHKRSAATRSLSQDGSKDDSKDSSKDDNSKDGSKFDVSKDGSKVDINKDDSSKDSSKDDSKECSKDNSEDGNNDGSKDDKESPPAPTSPTDASTEDLTNLQKKEPLKDEEILIVGRDMEEEKCALDRQYDELDDCHERELSDDKVSAKEIESPKEAEVNIDTVPKEKSDNNTPNIIYGIHIGSNDSSDHESSKDPKSIEPSVSKDSNSIQSIDHPLLDKSQECQNGQQKEKPSISEDPLSFLPDLPVLPELPSARMTLQPEPDVEPEPIPAPSYTIDPIDTEESLPLRSKSHFPNSAKSEYAQRMLDSLPTNSLQTVDSVKSLNDLAMLENRPQVTLLNTYSTLNLPGSSPLSDASGSLLGSGEQINAQMLMALMEGSTHKGGPWTTQLLENATEKVIRRVAVEDPEARRQYLEHAVKANLVDEEQAMHPDSILVIEEGVTRVSIRELAKAVIRENPSDEIVEQVFDLVDRYADRNNETYEKSTLDQKQKVSMFKKLAFAVLEEDEAKERKEEREKEREIARQMKILLTNQARATIQTLLECGDGPRFAQYLDSIYQKDVWDSFLLHIDEKVCRDRLGSTREELDEEARLSVVDYRNVIAAEMKRHAEKKKKRKPKIMTPEVDPAFKGKMNPSTYQFRGLPGSSTKSTLPHNAMICTQVSTDLLRAQGYKVDTDSIMVVVIADRKGVIRKIVDGLDSQEEIQHFIEKQLKVPKKHISDGTGYMMMNGNKPGGIVGWQYAKDDPVKFTGNPKKAKKKAKKLAKLNDPNRRRLEGKPIKLGRRWYTPDEIRALSEGTHPLIEALPDIDMNVDPFDVEALKAMHPWLKHMETSVMEPQTDDECKAVYDKLMTPIPLKGIDPSQPRQLYACPQDSSHTWQGVDQVKEYQSHYQLSSILKSEISSHNKKKFSEKKEEKPAEKGRRKAKKEKVAEMKSPPSIFSATPHDAPFQKQKMSVPLKEKTTVSMKEPVKSPQEQELAASSRERIESSLIDDLKKPKLLSEAKKTEKSDSSDEKPRYKPKEMSEEMKQDLLRLLKTKDEKQKLEAMAVKKKWTKAADVEDTEVPHKQMRMLDAMEVPYRLDSIKVITETNKRGTVLSKLTLLPYDTPEETPLPDLPETPLEDTSQCSAEDPPLSKSQRKKAKRRQAVVKAAQLASQGHDQSDDMKPNGSTASLQEVEDNAEEKPVVKLQESSEPKNESSEILRKLVSQRQESMISTTSSGMDDIDEDWSGDNASKNRLTARDRFNSCANCNQVIRERIQLCSGCKKVAYCNAACQKANWRIHKRTCTYAARKRTG